jgi:hypothetical protein
LGHGTPSSDVIGRPNFMRLVIALQFVTVVRPLANQLHARNRHPDGCEFHSSSSSISGATAQPARRRACLATLAAAAGAACWPSQSAHADAFFAGSKYILTEIGVPLPGTGRFEKLSGANAFIGDWSLMCTEGPAGTLSLLRDGDVELRALDGQLVGTSATPWTYKQREKGETTVQVFFSVDVSGSEWDVLLFTATVDTEGGPERKLEGSLTTGNGRKVGDFVAALKTK